MKLSKKTSEKLGAFAATIVSLVVLIAVVTGLISMLIPQLLTSIRGIIEALPSNIANLELWLEQMFVSNPEMEASVMAYYDMAVGYVQNWLTNDLIPNMYNIISGVSSGLFSIVNTVMDVFIGLIVMVYLLNMKTKLQTQAKMIIYGAFPLKIANKVIEECRFVHHVLFCPAVFKDALCASGQCYCRGYQYYPLLWAVYRSDSQCIFDFAGEPETVPVFYRSDSVAAAV